MILIYGIIFIFFYFFGLFYWNKNGTWRVNERISKIARITHYVGLLLCFGLIILFIYFDLILRFGWIWRVIFIITLITGIFYIFFFKKDQLKWFEKYYFILFSYFPFGVLFFVIFVPFLGFIIVLTLLFTLLSPSNIIYYEDEKFIIQENISVINISASILEKGIIFNKLLETPQIDLSENSNLSIIKLPNQIQIITEYELHDENSEKFIQFDTILVELK